MRIITLGTSHGDTTPMRFNSSVAYETVDGRLYLIDAGAPVEALLRRQGFRLYDLRAVFISHMHDDHAGGLTGLMKQTIKYPKDRPYPLPVYLPEEAAIEPLKLWFAAVHENPDNPLLDLFYEWIPQPFWYMLPVIPIVLIYLGAIYGIAALVKKKKSA